LHVHHQPNPSIHSCRPRRLTKAYFHLQITIFTWAHQVGMHHMAQQSPNATPFARTARASSSRSSSDRRTKATRTGSQDRRHARRGIPIHASGMCAGSLRVTHCTGTEGAGRRRRCFWRGSKKSGGIPRHHDKRAHLFNNALPMFQKKNALHTYVRTCTSLPRSQDG